MSVRIVQALCGPERHCITALAYLPGVTEIDGVVVDETNAADLVRDVTDAMLEARRWNPWCEICKRPREFWYFEDAKTKFQTLEEARPVLKAAEEAQKATRAFWGASRQ